MGENPSHYSRTGGGREAVKDLPDAELKRFPVEMVSWDQCQLFVAKLNKLTQETGWLYRLPTEVEWEYACRGGPMSESDKADSAFDFYFAKPTNTPLLSQANFKHDKGVNRTCKVGSYDPNALGIHDMHGNVWQWCNDPWKASDETLLRVYRGGSCFDEASGCLVSRREKVHPSVQDAHLGFRVARVPTRSPSR